MTKDWAEDIRAGYEATRLLRGGYQVEHVHVEEALPDNFCVVVYLAGYADPCVMGDREGTEAWLDARGIRATEAEPRPGQDYSVCRMLYGSRKEAT